MMEFKKIIIHCSATRDSGTVSWQAIEKYHIESLNWGDIGYHAGVEEVNYSDPKYKYVSLIGRSWTVPGAHCEGQNHDSFGLCFIGDYDIVDPEDDRLLFGIRRVVIPIMKMFNIGIDGIFFHRDFNKQKTCPGAKFSKTKFIGMLSMELKATGG